MEEVKEVKEDRQRARARWVVIRWSVVKTVCCIRLVEMGKSKLSKSEGGHAEANGERRWHYFWRVT